MGQAVASIEQLPDRPARGALLAQARALLAQVRAKAAGDTVAAAANRLRWDLIAAYRLAVAPKQPPRLAAAPALYVAQCAGCHGASGRGDGPAAQGMDPAAADFHDDERMRMRSVYGLYNTITLGVAGTAMRGYGELSEDERWALAFHVAALRHGADAMQRGQAAWAQPSSRAALRDLAALATLSPAEVLAQHGPVATQAQAWLTAHPEALAAAAPKPLDLARDKLDEAVARYAEGEREAARQLAIAAYLEGFEPVENNLDAVNAALRGQIEREMMALRHRIGSAQPAAEVAAQATRIKALLDQAQGELGGDALAPATAFASALLILLREGLEAILVLAAIMAFVRKTGRRDAMPWIHLGWAGAVVLGTATWFAADRLITISGAGRELTEGVTALLAAVMLLYVGYWLHSKSVARAWQRYISDQVDSALGQGRGAWWALAAVSFLAVYRELFEIVLFYQALWVQAGEPGQHAVLGGFGVAAMLLALLAWAILKYSVRLPIAPFFAVTAGLLAALAVVFAGHGVAALQEAGVLQASPVRFVSIPLLGVHATAQGLLAQMATVAVVAWGLWAARRGAAKAH